MVRSVLQHPPARVYRPTGGWQEEERRPPSCHSSPRTSFPTFSKSWEIGNRPESRVLSSGRPRTSDSNHPRGVTPLSGVDCSWLLLLLLLLLFLTFSVLVANPKKLLYTVANPARGLLNREKRTKEKVWQHTPPPHPPHCSFGENK